MNANANVKECPDREYPKFPCADMHPAFKDAHLYIPADLEIDPEKFFKLIVSKFRCPADINADTEFNQLLTLMDDRSKGDNKKLIYRDAQSENHAIQPVLDVLGIHIDRSFSIEALRWRQIVQDNLWGVLFRLKKYFNRARSWNHRDAKKLEPMFARPSRLYPGHDAYPSGHATMAYTWAYLLAELRSNKRIQLMNAADGVAFRRVIAGVHYPSDSDAGQQLAELLVTQFVKLDAFKKFSDAIEPLIK
jgi:membrane-associated phospholipid phosphatase